MMIDMSGFSETFRSRICCVATQDALTSTMYLWIVTNVVSEHNVWECLSFYHKQHLVECCSYCEELHITNRMLLDARKSFTSSLV